jgi:hypothetical protein
MDALDIITEAQNHGILLITENGYVMTKGAYFTMTGIRFNDSGRVKKERGKYNGKIDYDSDIRIHTPIRIDGGRTTDDMIDCMWVVASMMPDSIDFVASTGPWQVQFVVPEKENSLSKLYQVVHIKQGREIPTTTLLRNLPAIEGKEMRQQIRRIALIDDENFAWRMPKIGFSHIAKVDEKSPDGFRILEKRSEKDAWLDCSV